MKKSIAIVGGGACALMLAAELNPEKFEVTVYEHNAALGRKFLVAGDGGLNLTHSENESDFITRYTPFEFLSKAFTAFSNKHLMEWLHSHGVETFVGTSGRVFPAKGIKPVEVLNVFLRQLKRNRVVIKTKHQWLGFTNKGELLFTAGTDELRVKSDYVVFCLGGASWPVTGSTGTWLQYFEKQQVALSSFAASNCTFTIQWPAELLSKLEGKVLKNAAFSCAGKEQLGEAVITANGIEGSGVYPLSPYLRNQLQLHGEARLFVDFKPGIGMPELVKKLQALKGKDNYTQQVAKQLNLNAQQMALIKYYSNREEFFDPVILAQKIKGLALTVTGTGNVEEAISTTGGIKLEALTPQFELKHLPGHFCIGEMLDYDAPTGGYLLQSCFSMAWYTAALFNELNVSDKS